MKKMPIILSVLVIVVLATVLVGFLVQNLIFDAPDVNTTTKPTYQTTTTTKPTTTKPTTTKPNTTTSTTKPTSTTITPPSNKEYDITVWVNGVLGMDAFTYAMIDDFKAAHPEYKINVTVKNTGFGEGNIDKSSISADIYSFNQTHLPYLIASNAIAPLDAETSATVRNSNDVLSVDSVTYDGTIYGYPYASDNGYFLYYDKRIISDEQAKSLEDILVRCESSGKKLGFEYYNGWYTAAFFGAVPIAGGDPLCTSSWEYSIENNKFVGFNDTYNSNNGVKAIQKLLDVLDTGLIKNTSYDMNGTAAIVTGCWNYELALLTWGDDLGVAKLPTFTIDEQKYQMSSYSGFSYFGCKPQDDPIKAKICSELALFLSSEDVQVERFYQFMTGPSNKAAQQNMDVKENPCLQALRAQSVYSQVQGPIYGTWWEEVLLLINRCLAEPTLIKQHLEDYENRLQAIIDNQR